MKHENIYAVPFAFEGENYAPYQGAWTVEMVRFATKAANTGVIEYNDAAALTNAAKAASARRGYAPQTYTVFQNTAVRNILVEVINTRSTVKLPKKIRKLFEELANRPQTLVVEGKGLEKAIEFGIVPNLDNEDPDLLAQFVYAIGRIARRNNDDFIYRRGEILESRFLHSSPRLAAWVARNIDALTRGAEEIHLYQIISHEWDTPELSNRFTNEHIPNFGDIEQDLLDDERGCPFEVGFDTSLGDADKIYHKLVRENTPRTPEEAIDVATFAALRLFNLPAKIHKILRELEITEEDHAEAVGYLNPELYRYLFECGKIRKAFANQEPSLFEVYRWLQKYCSEENPTPTLRSALRSINYVYEQRDLFGEAERRFAENFDKANRTPKSFYVPGAKALLLGAHLGVTEVDTEAPDRDSFLAPEKLFIPGTPEYEEKFAQLSEKLPEPELDLSPEAFLKAKLGTYGSKYILECLEKARDKAEDPALSPWEAFLPEEGFGGKEMPFSPALRSRLSEEAYEDWVCSPGRPNDRLVEAKIAELNLEISAENQRKADLRAYLDGLDGKAIIAELEAFNASLGKPEGTDKAFLGF